MDQGTSAAGDPQVEWTSAAEDLETEEVPEIEEEPEIEGTSAAKDPPMDEISAADDMDPFLLPLSLPLSSPMRSWILELLKRRDGTSAAKDPPMDEISAADDMDPFLFQLRHPLSSPMRSWILELLKRRDGTPAAGDLLVEWALASEVRETEGVPDLEEVPEIEEDPSAAAEHTGILWKSPTKDPPMDPVSLPLPPMDEISATEGMGPFSFLMDRPIKGTAHAESTENRENHWPKNSIFRVPEHIRSSRESNFEPKLVSIGPYYHGRQNLKRMQDLKIRCIKEILKMLGIAVTRTNHPRPSEAGNPIKHWAMYLTGATVNPYAVGPPVRNHTLQEEAGINDEDLQKFMVLGRKAQAYYKEEFYYDDDEFVEMLFLDSCFIIRTIFAFSQQTQSMSFLDVHIKEVRSDLLLLDNQIPLFFIKKVYEWFLSNLKDKKLPQFNAVLEPFICLDMPWRINHDAKSSEAAHLLDLYWRYSLSPQMDKKLTSSERYRSETERDLPNSSEIDLSNNAFMVIANATELQQMAGIEFEKFKDKGHLDVTFSKGIMRMPCLKIDSRQKTLLRNLIAFENCIIPSMRTISCYLKLMDALINSEKDVELLQNCGVIYNTLSSHEMAATFFNDIGDFCFTDDKKNRFSDLYKDVQKYYDSPWHSRLASLRHNYFSSPWTGISVVAAVILLILSVVQTFYSVYGYHKPNN